MREGSIRRRAMYLGFGVAVWLVGSAAASAQIRCLCRYEAQNYDQGECVCMTTAMGDRLACCGRVLNNSSWNFVADGCVVAQNATLGAQSVSTLHAGPQRGLPPEPAVQQARLPDHLLLD